MQEEASSYDVQLRCSEACTRSGTLMLIFSVVAFAMLGAVESAINLNALARYVSLRDSINNALVNLSEDRCWQALRESSHGAAADSEWSIAELAEHNCSTSNPTVVRAAPGEEKATLHVRIEQSVPAAPTITTVTPITSIVEIAEAMRSLGEARLVERAKAARYNFAWSIYRWEMLRFKLHEVNRKRTLEVASVVDGPPQMEFYLTETGQIRPESWENYLTLADIRLLAESERPDSVHILEYFEKKRAFQVPAINQSLPVKSAILVVQFVLLMSVMHFWLYFAESRNSQPFPAAGTLFAVFDRTKATRAIYLALIATPLIASAALAVSSFEVTHWGIVPATCIGVLTVCIFTESLRPR